LSELKVFVGDSLLVIAPHPDDESLGCGGLMSRLAHLGTDCHVLIATGSVTSHGFDNWKSHQCSEAIGGMIDALQSKSVTGLGYESSKLEMLPMLSLIDSFRSVLEAVRPSTVCLPWNGDAHSDHRICHAIGLATTKAFRSTYIRNVLTYETLSETNVAGVSQGIVFKPGLWVDISAHLTNKVNACLRYQSEFAEHPFPRSEASIRALAVLRGSECNALAAEAFGVVRSFM